MLHYLSVVLTWPFRVYEQRRVMAQLGEMDDRALADIGLTRQDLRDATALRLGADPGLALAQRAQERESHVRRRRAQTQTKRQAAE